MAQQVENPHDRSVPELMRELAQALIVGVLYGGVAAILGLRGRTEIAAAMPPKPEQTIETVKEDVEWVKTRMS